MEIVVSLCLFYILTTRRTGKARFLQFPMLCHISCLSLLLCDASLRAAVIATSSASLPHPLLDTDRTPGRWRTEALSSDMPYIFSIFIITFLSFTFSFLLHFYFSFFFANGDWQQHEKTARSRIQQRLRILLQGHLTRAWHTEGFGWRLYISEDEDQKFSGPCSCSKPFSLCWRSHRRQRTCIPTSQIEMDALPLNSAGTSSVLGIPLIAFLVISLSDQDGFNAVTFH